MQEQEGALHVPAQIIAVPQSVSAAAQAFLAGAARRIAALSSGDGAATNGPSQTEQAAQATLFLRPAADRFSGTFETVELPSGALLYRATPDGRDGRKAHVVLFDIHGGAFVAGGGEMCQLLARIRAADYGVEVCAVDYRLAPQHVYPAALDDCVAAYQAVIARHAAGDIVVSGASAGGNLAAALMLRLCAEGLPLPAALMLLTPGLDMTRSGDSYRTNRYLDVTLYGGAKEGPDAYAGDHDPTDPFLSPLFGDIPADWPPTLLSSGTRDLLLSDTVRMHRLLRRAGVRADLHVTEAGPHGGFMGQAPEDAELICECHRFLHAAWGIAD
ncbi:alpha/beta hydrolase [Sphingobium sufflavum]|uniref:alpha/beta hydrolase n=1 Tax=Sphingobium sufflavum TaxID=1129547 RepID=UPI001F3A9E4B|nr:alpha/beta hydrolase [Sphingobium sufflavum]MCE7795943.1 alpha/beta hydrolase [Sphingobium sufflavum]